MKHNPDAALLPLLCVDLDLKGGRLRPAAAPPPAEVAAADRWARLDKRLKKLGIRTGHRP
jgi:hypothetical protein